MALAGSMLLLLTAAPAWGSGGLTTSSAPAPILATLTVQTAKVASLPAGFWGADVRPYYPLSTGTAALLNSTPVTTLRWPGGATGDDYNYTANRLYYNGGTYYSPPTNESQFVAFCRSVACQAILELPGEVDDPATAAYYVSYTLHNLHFSPAYWEIGNEPAQWTHFGIPWANWSTSQSVNATPGSYARVVQSYIAAIRAVAPTAAFVGLPGVGTGGYNEATWIRATVALNGPNLSAVAIHVYPAGGAPAGSNQTAASFLGTLTGNGALPARLPTDRAAISAACPACPPIRLLVTELGSGTQGGPFARYMAGYADMVYLAAEMAQAISAGVPNVDLFAWQSTYNGSLLAANGTTSRSFGLYSQMFPLLQPVVMNATLSGAPGSVFLAATRDLGNSTYTLLVVNANTTAGVQFNLPSFGVPLGGAGAAWTWQPTVGGGPQLTTWSSASARTWTLGPESVLVLEL